jgi:hypothetical protein
LSARGREIWPRLADATGKEHKGAPAEAGAPCRSRNRKTKSGSHRPPDESETLRVIEPLHGAGHASHEGVLRENAVAFLRWKGMPSRRPYGGSSHVPSNPAAIATAERHLRTGRGGVGTGSALNPAGARWAAEGFATPVTRDQMQSLRWVEGCRSRLAHESSVGHCKAQKRMHGPAWPEVRGGWFLQIEVSWAIRKSEPPAGFGEEPLLGNRVLLAYAAARAIADRGFRCVRRESGPKDSVSSVPLRPSPRRAVTSRR